jgi:hypothetical protein
MARVKRKCKAKATVQIQIYCGWRRRRKSRRRRRRRRGNKIKREKTWERIVLVVGLTVSQRAATEEKQAGRDGETSGTFLRIARL